MQYKCVYIVYMHIYMLTYNIYDLYTWSWTCIRKKKESESKDIVWWKHRCFAQSFAHCLLSTWQNKRALTFWHSLDGLQDWWELSQAISSTVSSEVDMEMHMEPISSNNCYAMKIEDNYFPLLYVVVITWIHESISEEMGYLHSQIPQVCDFLSD